MPRKNPYLFERYDQKLVVFSFYGRFHDLLPIVLGFQGDLQRLKTRYMFDSYDQKLVVFVFYVHFHELLPTFFGFLKDLPASEEPLHVFRDMTRTRHFRVYGHFDELFPTVLGSCWICNAYKTRYMFEIYDKKLIVFLFYGRLHELLPTI